MNTNVHKIPGIISGLVLAGSGFTAWATGFRLPDQDAFATGRGEAFVATADNPSAIYYNPAGIAQLTGNNFRAGIYGLDLEPSYRPLAPNGTTYDNQAKLHAAPQLYATYGLEDLPFTFGLGVYSPYGLGLRWPQDTGFRTTGTESALTYATINPVIGWQVFPNFSIGGGMTVNYAQIDLQQGLVWPTQNNDNFRFKGDGWDVGYNLGALWQPHEMLAFGVSFRSGTTVDFGGHTTYYNNTPLPLPGGGVVPAFPKQQVGASGDLNFPLNAILGVSFRPTPKWNFEFDADYADWSSVGTVTIHQDSGFPGLLPKDIPLVLDWQASWYYEFGVTRYLAGGWHVSAGYIYNENSVPDAHYSPVVADLNRHFFSVGIGRQGKRFDFDVAYQFGYGATRTVIGSAPSATGQTADGRYDFLSNALTASVGMHF